MFESATRVKATCPSKSKNQAKFEELRDQCASVNSRCAELRNKRAQLEVDLLTLLRAFNDDHGLQDATQALDKKEEEARIQPTTQTPQAPTKGQA